MRGFRHRFGIFRPEIPRFPGGVHRSKAATGKPRQVACGTCGVYVVCGVCGGRPHRPARGRMRQGRSRRADNKKDRSCKRSFRLNDSRESAVSGSSTASRGLLFDRWRSFAEQGCGSHGTHALLRTVRTADFRAASRPARNGEPILSRCRSAWDPPSAHSFRGACCRGTA